VLRKTKFNNLDYVLDIGGNDGTFLKNFVNKRIKSLNVDSGVKQFKESKKNGVSCINDFFNYQLAKKIYKKYGSSRVIHGSGIFFHLEELNSVFKGIKFLLDENGILVAEFIYLPNMIKKNAFDQIYHEHLLYYSINTFQKLLKRHNLEIFDAKIYEIHGGSCVAFISHKEKFKKSPFLKKIINKEIKEGINKITTYKTFKKNIINLKIKLNKLPLDLKKGNKKVYALGAPVKGSTLINFLDLNEDLIECATEINQNKFNTYYPGTKIPVLNQAKVKHPDYYLLLSWNFKDEIIKKMKDFRKSGGKFIIPIPNVRVL